MRSSMSTAIVFGWIALLPFVECHTGSCDAEKPSTTGDALAAGREASRRGDFEQAVKEWSKAAKTFEKKGALSSYVAALNSLATAYQSLGRYEIALETLETALDTAQKTGDRRDLLLTKSNLGNVCTFMRQTQRGESLLREGLAMAREEGDPRTIAGILNSLGNLLTARELDSEAEQAYTEALTLARQSQDQALEAKAGVNLAKSYVLTDRLSEAVRTNDAVLKLLQGLKSSHDKAYLLIGVGHVCREAAEDGTDSGNGLLPRAAQAYTAAQKIAEEISDQRSASFALGYLGEVYEKEQRYEEALRLTRKARFLAQQLQSPQILYRWQWQMGRLLRDQGKTQEAIAQYREAVRTLREAWCDVAAGYGNRTLRTSFREGIGGLYFQLADLLLQQADTLTEPKAVQRNLVEARDTLESLKTAELDDYFKDDCVTAGLSRVTDVEAVLHTSAAVYYIPLRDRTEILLSLPSGLERFKSSITLSALTAKVRRFRIHLERPSSEEYLKYGQDLYDVLVRPLEQALISHQVKTLIFVPDGSLRTIPMGALYDGKQFLIEKFSIGVTPGLALMDPHPLSRERVGVFAGGLSESVQGFDPLQYTKEELGKVTQQYQCRTYMDKDFMSANVQQSCGESDYSIIHIASHGEFTGDAKKSYILTYDSRLTLDDLDHLLRPRQFQGKPVELLALSACQTAAGDDRAALGLAGIAVKAGARSALATLWSINDEATAELIGEFYSQLKSNPSLSKAEAMQQAQLKLLRGERFQHPAYWAPYLIIGNWM